MSVLSGWLVFFLMVMLLILLIFLLFGSVVSCCLKLISIARLKIFILKIMKHIVDVVFLVVLQVCCHGVPYSCVSKLDVYDPK